MKYENKSVSSPFFPTTTGHPDFNSSKISPGWSLRGNSDQIEGRWNFICPYALFLVPTLPNAPRASPYLVCLQYIYTAMPLCQTKNYDIFGIALRKWGFYVFDPCHLKGTFPIWSMIHSFDLQVNSNHFLFIKLDFCTLTLVSYIISNCGSPLAFSNARLSCCIFRFFIRLILFFFCPHSTCHLYETLRIHYQNIRLPSISFWTKLWAKSRGECPRLSWIWISAPWESHKK